MDRIFKGRYNNDSLDFLSLPMSQLIFCMKFRISIYLQKSQKGIRYNFKCIIFVLFSIKHYILNMIIKISKLSHFFVLHSFLQSGLYQANNHNH